MIYMLLNVRIKQFEPFASPPFFSLPFRTKARTINAEDPQVYEAALQEIVMPPTTSTLYRTSERPDVTAADDEHTCKAGQHWSYLITNLMKRNACKKRKVI